MAGKQKKNRNDKCFICSEYRAVDRCHIIPKAFLQHIQDFNHLARFDNANIILLCKNHHWYMDHFKLNDEEWRIILEYVKGNLEHEFEHLISSEFNPIGKVSRLSIKRRNRFYLWVAQIKAKYLIFYNEE